MDGELRIGTLLRLPEMTMEILQYLASAGLETTQLCRAGNEWLVGEAGVKKTEESFKMLADCGLDAVSLFMMMAPGTTGDGLVSEDVRTRRMVFACRQMLWAKKHDIKYITCHVGFLAKIGEGDAYWRMVADFQQMLDFAAENGQYYLFETGPEPVEGLKKIFADIDRPNLGINFDPANMLIYNHDEPSVLVNELWDRIKVVHCKDAVRPTEPGVYGKETVLGQGDTHFVEVMRNLLGRGFRGPLIIERELPYGPVQRKDVAEAICLLKSIRSEFI